MHLRVWKLGNSLLLMVLHYKRVKKRISFLIFGYCGIHCAPYLENIVKMIIEWDWNHPFRPKKKILQKSITASIRPSCWPELFSLRTYLPCLFCPSVRVPPVCVCVCVASCAVVQPWEAVIIGAIGGVLAVLSVRLMDRLHIDDPVGAISVHGVVGIWVSARARTHAFRWSTRHINHHPRSVVFYKSHLTIIDWSPAVFRSPCKTTGNHQLS